MIRPLLVHCMSAMYPPSEDLPGVAELNPEPFVDTALSEIPWLMWFGVVGSVALFVVTPVFTVWRPVPSFWLSADKLDEHATRLVDHPLYMVRQSTFLLKMMAGLHWAAHERVLETWALPAYPPDPDNWRTS